MSTSPHATERSPLIRKGSSHGGSLRGEDTDTTPDDVESPQQVPDAENPDLLQARKNVKYMLPVVGVGIFLAFLDQSIIAAINGDIGSDLNALRSVSWIATAYFLTMTCSQPLYGKLSDVFGRKPCLLFAFTMFGVGSLGCGLTRTMAGLIAARAVQGIGGGGMLIVVTVLLSDLIPLRERGTYQGYLNLIGAIGSTSGGPIGGLFVQSIGWRWAFLIQVFLCLVAMLAVAFFLHPPHRKSEGSLKEQLKHIDFLGALLLILIVFVILFGLDRGANVSWRSPLTIASLCAIIPFLLAFLWVETRFASEPFTPGHVIFDKALCACYVQNFFGYAGFTALIFYIPFFFQVVLEMTPAQAGVGLIPAAISAVVGTLLGGFILKRIGKFYWLALTASIVGTVAAIPIALAPSLHRGSTTTIYIASVASFVPQGITITASLIAIISNVTPADQAVATACSFLFRSLGAAVGVSLVGLVIQQVLSMRLRATLSPDQADQILENLAKTLDTIARLPPDLRIAVEECYRSGIQSAYIMCVALLGVSASSVVWWREKKMSK
ncbi:MAG: hypothetical protein Q9182_006070 [Xanthomendoza sp. 2 TL-2023]